MSADTENVDRQPSLAGGAARAPRAIRHVPQTSWWVHVGGARRLKSCPANKGLRSAVEDCLNGDGIPDATALIERAKALASSGGIDPLADLSKDRVYPFRVARIGSSPD